MLILYILSTIIFYSLIVTIIIVGVSLFIDILIYFNKGD